MNLARALRLGPLPRLALVGAGGKTSALFQLARQLGGPCLVTASTHLAAHQLGLADQHRAVERAHDLLSLEEKLPDGLTLFTGPLGADQRTKGLDPASLQTLNRFATRHKVPLLIEADGARQRPLKAPAEHEPALPDFVDHVVVVAGLSALGQPLDDRWVHRPERFAALSGLQLGQGISPQAVAQVLSHPQGGLKNIPPASRRVVLLNQTDTSQQQALAQELAQSLLSTYHAVAVASLASPDGSPGHVLASYQPTAGIVLAAGGSDRLGQPKQLLAWRGQPFVRHVVQTALRAGLSPVVVVLGAHAEQVRPVIADLPVMIVHNADWQLGQSSSVKLGVVSLPPEAGAAIFLLVDQPQVPITLLRTLLATHATALPAIVAPQVAGKRATPVLFDRATFPDFAALEGDVGGRAIFSRHRLTWVPWLDPSLALDVDTMADYQKLLEYER